MNKTEYSETFNACRSILVVIKNVSHTLTQRRRLTVKNKNLTVQQFSKEQCVRLNN